jgi:hypothetical protein
MEHLEILVLTTVDFRASGGMEELSLQATFFPSTGQIGSEGQLKIRAGDKYLKEGIKIKIPYLQLEKIRTPRNLKIRFKYHSAPPPVGNHNRKKIHPHKRPFAQSLRRGLPKEGTPRNRRGTRK